MITANGTSRMFPAQRKALLLTTIVTALTILVFTLACIPSARQAAQGPDHWWLRFMLSIRTPPLTAIALVLNPLGMTYVTLPVRIAVAGFLVARRRWWAAAAFVIAMVTSQTLSDVLKSAYGRARPPGSLVATIGASFPSGHAVAASVTCIAAVIVLVPAGRRIGWGIAAIAFSLLMAWSRTYLAAHWLSDTIAGLLLGTSCALLAALATDQLARRLSSIHRVNRGSA